MMVRLPTHICVTPPQWVKPAKCLSQWVYGTFLQIKQCRYGDVIMSVIATKITGVSTICSTVCSVADQRTHQSSAPLASLGWVHRWIRLTKGQHHGKRFHLMTSSWWCDCDICVISRNHMIFDKQHRLISDETFQINSRTIIETHV